MDYYEELGLSPHASPDEIRDAYRALARLLHPDHQRDPALQLVAEQQVKKINKIYEVLSDPDRRRAYDQDLFSSRERQTPIIIHAPPVLPRRRMLTRGSMAWTAAVGGFLILLVWMASREVPNTASDTRDSGASIVELPARPVVQAPAPAPPPAAAPVPVPAPVDTKSAQEAEALRQRLNEALGERDDALARLAKKDTPPPPKIAEPVRKAVLPEERKREFSLPVVARVTPPSTPIVVPPPPVIAPRHPLAGQWVYRKPSAASGNKDLYPPEFIETTIVSEPNGEVKGTYRARYIAPNRPTSPDVTFQFAGRVNGDAGNLPWSGSGGSKGEVTLKLMADHSLRVDWTASQLGSLGFYKGTAVLVKRAD